MSRVEIIFSFPSFPQDHQRAAVCGWPQDGGVGARLRRLPRRAGARPGRQGVRTPQPGDLGRRRGEITKYFLRPLKIFAVCRACCSAGWAWLRWAGGSWPARWTPAGWWAGPSWRTTGRATARRTSPGAATILAMFPLRHIYSQIGLKCDKESYTNLIKEDAMHLQFTPPPIGTLGESLKTFQHTFLLNLVRKWMCRHVSSLRDNSLLVLHGLQDTRVNVSNTWALARSLVSQVRWGHGSRSVDSVDIYQLASLTSLGIAYLV